MKIVNFSASPGDPGRQLPTVSSRYHSPSLKRSRGRHNDETIVSDEEVQKAKMIKKSFTSPERKCSPKPSPKNSPKLSPKICSPKSRSGQYFAFYSVRILHVTARNKNLLNIHRVLFDLYILDLILNADVFSYHRRSENYLVM